MPGTRVPALACALLLAACGGHAPRTAPAVVPVYADSAQFRADADAIVAAFNDAVARARGTPLDSVPAVQVRNTPQLIFYSRRDRLIVAPWWPTLPEAQRGVFTTFAGGSAAEGERLFRLMFNRFLVAHEATHWLQARAGRRAPTLYENESMANRVAVAFWRTQPGGEAMLAELERLTALGVAALPDPTPAGEDPVAYFGANYQALGRDPLKYGYYQFRFTRDALRERERLDFARMVRGEQP